MEIRLKNTPERNLWTAVLVQFLRDIKHSKKYVHLHYDRTEFTSMDKYVCEIIWQDAINMFEFLTELTGSGIKDVCESAGVDYGKFKSAATKIIDNKIDIEVIGNRTVRYDIYDYDEW